ncbi:MAG: hypothetical protein V3W31_08845 [Thermodesulfobacteriota bacterium]
MPSVGDTFLSPTPQFDTKHLYIIIAEETSSDKLLVVNVTSPKDNCDTTCVLLKGEHPFIKYPSIINYADAIEMDRPKVAEALSNKNAQLILPHKPVSGELLERIRTGALTSPAFPPKYLKYLP